MRAPASCICHTCHRRYRPVTLFYIRYFLHTRCTRCTCYLRYPRCIRYPRYIRYPRCIRYSRCIRYLRCIRYTRYSSFVLDTEDEFLLVTVLRAFVAGGVGSQGLNRGAFAQMVPRGHEAEFFGAYFVAVKMTSWVGET